MPTSNTIHAPSSFPPANHRPSSLARLPNGMSSSSPTPTSSPAFRRLAGLRSPTHRAREHNASLSIPASVVRPSVPWFPFSEVDGVMNERLKRTTSSRMSSSHRLSLKPSDARTRMSSFLTSMENVWASCGRVGEHGPSWTGVLNYGVLDGGQPNID